MTNLIRILKKEISILQHVMPPIVVLLPYMRLVPLSCVTSYVYKKPNYQKLCNLAEGSIIISPFLSAMGIDTHKHIHRTDNTHTHTHTHAHIHTTTLIHTLTHKLMTKRHTIPNICNTQAYI